MTRPRGRPVGTLKRAEAVQAAEAILRGEFDDVRSAAMHFRPKRIGSDEGFRDFVRYVEEALRDANGGSLRRKFYALSFRSKHRNVQHVRRSWATKALKQNMKETGLLPD